MTLLSTILAQGRGGATDTWRQPDASPTCRGSFSRFNARRSNASASSIWRPSSRHGTGRSWRCASTACSPRRGSTSGCLAIRSTSASLLYTPDGRPRVVHRLRSRTLAMRERMLVVSMVLNAVLDWTRRRAAPRRCARCLHGRSVRLSAAGGESAVEAAAADAAQAGTRLWRGVVLATQNPVDLDYKALSNTGTWFLGKLQTERDKARVLDGIESLSSAHRPPDARQALSSLQRRVFLMHNVHEPQPVAVRDALDALLPARPDEPRRAPSERRLKAGIRRSGSAPTGPDGDAARGVRRAARPHPSPAQQPRRAASRPSAAGRDPRGVPRGDGAGRPSTCRCSYGAARVHYADARRGIDHTRGRAGDGAVRQRRRADRLGPRRSHPTMRPDSALERQPTPRSASYAALPAAALIAEVVRGWTRTSSNGCARTCDASAASRLRRSSSSRSPARASATSASACSSPRARPGTRRSRSCASATRRRCSGSPSEGPGARRTPSGARSSKRSSRSSNPRCRSARRCSAR